MTEKVRPTKRLRSRMRPIKENPERCYGLRRAKVRHAYLRCVLALWQAIFDRIEESAAIEELALSHPTPILLSSSNR